MAAALATRTRDPYEFANHNAIPPIPRDALTKALQAWDNTSDETTVLEYFTPDAVLKFGGDHVGRQAIRAARNSMIHPEKGPIVKCQHFFENAYVLAGSVDPGPIVDASWEIIGIADVRYTLVGTGEEVWTRAASWAKIVRQEGDWRAQAYEVFMDGSKLFEAIGKLGQ